MKNKSLNRDWIASVLRTSALVSALFFAAGNGALWASAELDRQYALETIGFIKAWDNVDGLFADYVAAAYRGYFNGHSRFVVQDLSKADPILSKSKISYTKLIDDPEILGQLARAARAQTIIRTKIFKEGAQYRFILDWLHSPKMELIATDTFTLTEPRDGREGQFFGLGDIKTAITSALDRMIKKVPFSGHVTGRDNNSVTLNLGYQSSDIQPGDILVLSTLEDVKKHPLLKQIVDWRFSDVGKVEVEQVDRQLSFAKVLEEEPGRKIARYQKIIQIQRKPLTASQDKVVYSDEEERRKAAAEPPRLGWVSGGPWLGSFDRQYSQKRDPVARTGNNVIKDGGGFLFGAKAETQLWLTHEFFTDLVLGYGLFEYSQKNLPVGSTDSGSPTIVPKTNVGSGNVVNFKIDFGYSYLVNGDFFGPKGWVKLGYHAVSYSLPVSLAQYTTPTSFNSLFLGIGGDLPIRDQWGAHLNLDFGLLKGANEDNNIGSGSVSGASDVEFVVGGYYRWNPKMSFKLDFDIMASGADFSPGGNLTHKAITFVPSVVVYF